MWYTYILKCADGSLYTGSTTDTSRRIIEHNSGKGGNYTRSRLPVSLVFREKHVNRSCAQKRESEIKKMTRKTKLLLIEP